MMEASQIFCYSKDNTVDCTETCDCLHIQMEVVHGSDGKTFVSPCHAGCKSILVGADSGKYVSYFVVATHLIGYFII